MSAVMSKNCRRMANVTHAIATQEVRDSVADWLVANRLLLFDRKK